METVSCNLCGSENYQTVYSMPDAFYFKDEWFNVVECKNCGLGFLNPRPTYEEMSRYYPPAYYHDRFDNERDARRYAEEGRFLQNLSSSGSGLMLLDVGCANGDFPRHMGKLGWQVEGVEPSSNSEYISDFKVYPQEFTHIPLYEPRYNAITAWAVLEHVHDPMSYFKQASQLLKSGGSFIFLVTNFESVSSRCLFREDVPRHLYFFTESTIKKYLALSGLELVKTDYSNRILSMRPVGWLRHYLYHYFEGRGLKWEDIPPNRTEYVAKRGLSNNLPSNLRYIASHPFAVADRLLMPLFEKYQMLSNKYGIVTYVAVKP